MYDNLQQWADLWFSTFRTLVRAAEDLSGKELVPAGGTIEERLLILLDLLKKLNLQVGETLDPATSRVREVRYALEQSRHKLEDLLRAVCTNIDREIGKLLPELDDERGGPAILTTDFGRTGVVRCYGSRPLTCGIRSSLPARHWLREAFPPDRCYSHDGEPTIILGCPMIWADEKGPVPRAWYPLAVAKEFTQRIADLQKGDQEKRRQEEQEQARLAQERWSASAAGKEATRRSDVERLQARVAELERQLAPPPNGTGGAA